MRYWTLFILSLSLYCSARAEIGSVSDRAVKATCEPVGPACILEAAWGAALLLPEDKQQSLIPVFVDTAAVAGDPALLSHWQSRLDTDAPLSPAASYPDYGWQVAEPILKARGASGLIALARSRQPPLNFGRTDVLLSAGLRMSASRPGVAAQMNKALLDLIQDASDFEKPSLAQAAAHLAAYRCDSSSFEAALRHVDTPENLRLAFWRARLDQNLQALPDRIRNQAIESDTRHVRQVLDGYRLILEQGFCTKSDMKMAD